MPKRKSNKQASCIAAEEGEVRLGNWRFLISKDFPSLKRVSPFKVSGSQTCLHVRFTQAFVFVLRNTNAKINTLV